MKDKCCGNCRFANKVGSLSYNETCLGDQVLCTLEQAKARVGGEVVASAMTKRGIRVNSFTITMFDVNHVCGWWEARSGDEKELSLADIFLGQP